MRTLLDALSPATDPIVAVHRSRYDADTSLEALRRAGYDRSMLTVVGQSGTALDVAGVTQSLAPRRQHWAASGACLGMLWAVISVAAVFLAPAGGMAFATLVALGALALLLQSAVMARIVAPERDGPGSIAAATPRQVPSDRGTMPWHFLVVVRGSRSDIALARDILAIH